MPHQPHALASCDLQLPSELIGAAPAVRHAADVMRRAAATDDAVLIVAEPGFRAERVARAIHAGSSRSRLPFSTVNCADAPATVVQLLFGEAAASRGSYETAAAHSAVSHVGGGTLFLSGVEEMPAAAQLRLSRLLRDGEMRVRKAVVPIRFRLMASTSPGLETDVQEQRFRPELYRRLQRLRVDVPPLRTRREDLPAIIDAVLAEVSSTSGLKYRLAPAAVTALAALQWPGNFEELRAVLTRLVERADGGLIRQEDVLADLQQPGARSRARRVPTASLREARLTFEREYIATVLEEYGWRMTEAARALGIERANLYRKTRQLGITRLKPSTTP